MTVAAGARLLASDHAISMTSYTPLLLASTTSPTLGSGSQAMGRYWLDPITGWVRGQGFIRFGTSGVSAGSGNYIVTLPVNAFAFASATTGQSDIFGLWSANDASNSIAARWGPLVRSSAGPAAAFLALYTGSSPVVVTDSVPWTWAAQDAITYWFWYPSTQ